MLPVNGLIGKLLSKCLLKYNPLPNQHFKYFHASVSHTLVSYGRSLKNVVDQTLDESCHGVVFPECVATSLY